MARKIGVLEPERTEPSTYVKKCVAQLLVRRALAVWVIRNVRIRLVELPPAPSGPPTSLARYIPLKMPPREVPGCWFQPPQSDSWKRQHRTAWQSYPASGGAVSW